MNNYNPLSATLDLMRTNIHQAKRPITGILADKKLTCIPVQHIKGLMEILETVELHLEALSLFYAGETEPPADGQAVGK